jgi:endonuclease/exonuclease/phosphatase family metal-dependent hydrolase
MMFSALTFNMQNGQPWIEENPDDPTVNLESTVAFLREQDADVVFLQEVERGYEGGRQEDPPPHYGFLKQALAGYDSIFGYPLPNPLEIPFGLGLAIFSKTPLNNFYRRDLPPAEISFEYGGKPRKPSHRLLLGADTQIGGHSVHLLNTHLQAFFMIEATSTDHPAQRELVEEELRRCQGPTVLAGDFNAAPRENIVEQFAQVGFQASQTQEVTWRRMPFVLDHIFFNNTLKLERCQVIPTPASDHHAVRSEFSFVR